MPVWMDMFVCVWGWECQCFFVCVIMCEWELASVYVCFSFWLCRIVSVTLCVCLCVSLFLSVSVKMGVHLWVHVYLKGIFFFVCVRVGVNVIVGDSVGVVEYRCVSMCRCVWLSVFGFASECAFGCRCGNECVGFECVWACGCSCESECVRVY
jgi:hypothetical protein